MSIRFGSKIVPGSTVDCPTMFPIENDVLPNASKLLGMFQCFLHHQAHAMACPGKIIFRRLHFTLSPLRGCAKDILTDVSSLSVVYAVFERQGCTF